MENPFTRRRQKLDGIKALKPHDPGVANRARRTGGDAVTCPECSRALKHEALAAHLYLCPHCGHHLRMPARARLEMLFDTGTAEELDKDLASTDPLEFPGYARKLKGNRDKTGLADAAISVRGTIDSHECVGVALDTRFMMGSMGVAVGEKVTRAAERATDARLPLVIASASGGARMQEGIYSLMQMAKTAAAVRRHSDAGLFFLSLMCDPTTGGVTASFASLGDIIIAEPGALIGFAGPRVIEQTIRQKLPQGFQRAEYLLEHGFVDAVVARTELKRTVAALLALHAPQPAGGGA